MEYKTIVNSSGIDKLFDPERYFFINLAENYDLQG